VFATLALAVRSSVALGGHGFTQTTGVVFSLGVLVFLGVGVFLGRASLLRTAINRRYVATACALAGVPLLARLQGLAAGSSVKVTAFTILLALGAALLAAGCALGSRRLAAAGGVLLAGSIVSALVWVHAPARLLLALCASLLSGLALLAASRGALDPAPEAWRSGGGDA
jgi:hypothetical protein